MFESRTNTYEVTFSQSFEIKSIGERLPAGTYVIEDEEVPLALSSAIGYRRIATTIRVPTASGVTLHTITPADLEEALNRDVSFQG